MDCLHNRTWASRKRTTKVSLRRQRQLTFIQHRVLTFLCLVFSKECKHLFFIDQPHLKLINRVFDTAEEREYTSLCNDRKVELVRRRRKNTDKKTGQIVIEYVPEPRDCGLGMQFPVFDNVIIEAPIHIWLVGVSEMGFDSVDRAKIVFFEHSSLLPDGLQGHKI